MVYELLKLNFLVFFRHFLILLPQLDVSEETFCSYYLIVCKWKQIIQEKEHTVVDNTMCLRFKVLEGSFQKILKKVFVPPLDPVSIISMVVDRLNFAVKTYFDYLKNNQIQESEPECDFVIDSDEDVRIVVS